MAGQGQVSGSQGTTKNSVKRGVGATAVFQDICAISNNPLITATYAMQLMRFLKWLG
jgi:hypothetical protein